MPLDTPQRRFTKHLVWLLVLLIALQVRDVAKLVGLPIPKIPVPYGGGIADNLLSVLVVLVAAALLHPGTPGEIAARLGLRWNGLRGPALTLLATLPCWLGLWTQSTSVGTDDLLGLLWLALLFPLAEEIVFRGFGFVFACRALAWRPAIAALVQAVVFGGVHWLGAGGGGGDALLIFAITGIGALLFAIVDAQDGYTIWSGWVLHVSLNAAWTVFAVSDSAASGWLGMALRLSAVFLAMGLLRLFVRPRRSVRADVAS
ncbi:CPBP family glutamic-type intramembrane protease [Xanthomonas hortorum]|uniref:CPBP family glutamic-type intramembrane protease n=1 Tax=Xanthomonas hortorum TaxID=56454 RepID=UPI0015932449|nr:CPBP family glutamic-type intramembrane protease [Xanthomonas hortorum]NHF64952.1 CPBP family intramembrane metalloprotease [Xanthomonas hortorum]